MRASIDPSLRDQVRPVLDPGEILLWAGRPDPRRTARRKVVQALFGVLFLLLIILVYVSGVSASGSYRSAVSVPFTLRPAIIAACALFVLYGALLPVFAYWTALKTVYAATDRRVLTLVRGRSARMVRYEDMQVPLLEMRHDGRGDITFNGRFRADGTEYHPQFSHFLGIEAAGSVYQLLLGRMPGSDSGRTASPQVEDYLEMLLQGKRTLDDDASRH